MSSQKPSPATQKTRKIQIIQNLRRGALPLLLAASAMETGAVSLRVETYDLPDVMIGEDLRRGKVLLDGAILEGQGFTVYFPFEQFTALSNGTTANEGWDLLVIPPDPGLGLDGFLDGLNLQALGDVEDPFCFDFVYGGGRISGRYAFEVYDTTGGFEVVERGETEPVVRVPDGGVSLFLGGLVWLGLGCLGRGRGK